MDKNLIRKLNSESCILCRNYYYFVGRNVNILYKVDMDLSKLEVVWQSNDEDYLQERLYNGMCQWRDNIILIPFNAKRVWIWNTQTEKWSSYCIDNYVNTDLKGKFVGGYLYQDKLLLFGYHYSGILQIDLNNGEVKEFISHSEKHKYCFWGHSFVEKENIIYLTNMESNEVILIDLIKNNYQIKSVGDNNNRYSGICYDDKYFWLTPRTGNRLIRWDGKNGVFGFALDDFYKNEGSFFNGIIEIGNNLILYNPQGKSYCFNKKMPKESRITGERILYAVKVSEYVSLMCMDGVIRKYFHDLGISKEIPNCISEVEYMKLLDNNMKAIEKNIGGKVCKENEEITLNDFIHVISSI